MAKGKQASYDPTKSKKLTIYVAEKYPEFQQRYRDVLQKHLEAEGNTDIKAVISKIDKKDMKKAMPLLQHLKKRLESGEPPERVFERQLPFSETDVLREMVPGLRAGVRKLEVVEIVRLRDDGKADVAFVGADEQFVGAASKVGDVVDGLSLEVAPGTPAVFFGNIEASS
jgi:leucyl-tRNA synthetase